MSIGIRSANSDDRQAICRLHLASWQANYHRDVSKDVLENVFPVLMEKQWAKRSFTDPELILVAEDKELIGFAFVLTDRVPAYIDNVHVRPGLQSRGVGRSLLSAVFKELRDRRCNKAALEVLTSNQRARQFYERLGGVDVGSCTGNLFGTEVTERRIVFDLEAI